MYFELVQFCLLQRVELYDFTGGGDQACQAFTRLYLCFLCEGNGWSRCLLTIAKHSQSSDEYDYAGSSDCPAQVFPAVPFADHCLPVGGSVIGCDFFQLLFLLLFVTPFPEISAVPVGAVYPVVEWFLLFRVDFPQLSVLKKAGLSGNIVLTPFCIRF